MTLFSYHKYNDFILIQEIYTQKYTACTKDEANRIADNNLQSDGISYANGLAHAIAWSQQRRGALTLAEVLMDNA